MDFLVNSSTLLLPEIVLKCYRNHPNKFEFDMTIQRGLNLQ